MGKSILPTLFVIASLCIVNVSASADDALRSVQWAERLLAHSSFQYQLSHGYGTQAELRSAEEAFRRILAKHGQRNGRARAGLARALALLGHYDGAVDSYKQALLRLPADEVLGQELGKVSKQLTAAKAAAATLPPGETVLLALPYPHVSHDLWVVLSAQVKWDKDFYWPETSNSHLNMFKGKPNALKRVWRSPVLGYPGHTNGEFNDIYLYVKDVTGDGNPDLVLPERFFGADWAPSHIDIFTWRAGEVKHLLGAVSDEILIVKDLNRDRRYEVITDHAVGWSMSHADQPRWLYTYAYRSGAFQLAESDFPGQYRDLYCQIRTLLRSYPNDFELLYYFGRVNEIRRRPCVALRAYRRAERGAVKEIAEWRRRDTFLDQRALNVLREIKALIHVLSAARWKAHS